MNNIFGEELQEPEYLGDGIYAGHDGYQIWIGANAPTGTVALEPGVFLALLRYAKKVGFKVENTK